MSRLQTKAIKASLEGKMDLCPTEGYAIKAVVIAIFLFFWRRVDSRGNDTEILHDVLHSNTHNV